MTIASFINLAIMAMVGIAFAIQFFLDFSTENIACASLVVASSFAVLLYIRWTSAIKTHPLSTFVLFGLCVTMLAGALIVQSALGTSLINSLRQPLETFSILAIYQLAALLMHAIYRQVFTIKPVEGTVVRSAFEGLGIYKTPSIWLIWGLGGVGMMAIVVGGGSKVAHGISFLAWVPFLIPLLVYREGKAYCNAPFHYLLLAGYFGGHLMHGIAHNGRGGIFLGLVAIALVYLLEGMRANQKITFSVIAKIVVAMAVSVALIIPLSDLSTAMGIARKGRGSATPEEMMENTFRYLSQPHEIQKYREDTIRASRFAAYDENYIPNPLFARFIDTKFVDNSLYFATRINEKDREFLWEDTQNKFWAVLPAPFLEWLGVGVNKSLTANSFGDVIAYLNIGSSLGSYKTGSLFAHGIGLFEHYFILVFLFLSALVYVFMDMLTFRSRDGQVHLSIVAMVNIYPFFHYGIAPESLDKLWSFFVRNYWQMILLYSLIFLILRLMVRAFPKFPGMTKPKSAMLPDYGRKL